MQTPHRRLLITVTLLAVSCVAPATPGRDLWMANCRSCHGEDGDGRTAMGKRFRIPDYTQPDAQAGLTDADIRSAITNGLKDEKGRRTMLAFGKRLTDAEIDTLVAYFRSLPAD